MIAHKEQLLKKFLNFAASGEKSRHHAFRKRFAIPLVVNLDNSRELWSIKGVLPMWYSYILSIIRDYYIHRCERFSYSVHGQSRAYSQNKQSRLTLSFCTWQHHLKLKQNP